MQPYIKGFTVCIANANCQYVNSCTTVCPIVATSMCPVEPIINMDPGFQKLPDNFQITLHMYQGPDRSIWLSYTQTAAHKSILPVSYTIWKAPLQIPKPI